MNCKEQPFLSEQHERIEPYRIVTFYGKDTVPGFNPRSKSASVGGVAGGSFVIPEMQTRALREFGHDAVFLTPLSYADTSEFKGDYYEFISSNVPKETSIEEISSNAELMDEVASKVGDAQIIYVNHILAASIIIALKKLNKIDPSIKIVYTGLTWGRGLVEWRKFSPSNDEVERNVLITADKIVVYTQAEKQSIIDNYSDVITSEVLREKIRVTPLGVDNEINPDSIQERRRRIRDLYLGELSNTLNFFMMGRISVQKNQLQAIEAFYRTLQEHPDLNISLSIFGDEGDGSVNHEYSLRVQQYVAELPPNIRSKIKFFGVQSQLDALSVGDVFYGPSIYETWFLAATEAMACGLPTILSDIPVLREVAGNASCYVNLKDIESIKNAIVLMAESPIYRQYIGAYNYQRAKHYTWEKSTSSLNDVFDEVMSN